MTAQQLDRDAFFIDGTWTAPATDAAKPATPSSMATPASSGG